MFIWYRDVIIAYGRAADLDLSSTLMTVTQVGLGFFRAPDLRWHSLRWSPRTRDIYTYNRTFCNGTVATRVFLSRLDLNSNPSECEVHDLIVIVNNKLQRIVIIIPNVWLSRYWVLGYCKIVKEQVSINRQF